MSLIENRHPAIHQASANQVIAALVSGGLRPGSIWQRRGYRMKYLCRTLLFWPSTHYLMSAIATQPWFPDVLRAQSSLPGKIHRQYLHLGLGPMARAQAIVQHYQWATGICRPAFGQALMAATPQMLVSVSGKNDARLQVFASGATGAQREGESTLWCYCDDVLLATLTFSVVDEQGQWVVKIGGLQGAKKTVPHEAIKQATRACYGLFPKRVLIEVLGILAQQEGIARIYAVSDSGHIFRALRYRFSKGRKFFASYNEFWASINGVPVHRYYYQLPLSQPRKAIDDIASKKRAEYRNRYQLLDALAGQLRP
ncbi:DUF535 domain-containing protein [Shimwellia pseudoproteus]|uniref:VirK/YbjX family protein n=1 Tax=Shimwellia pseudoproteus TaxID=570012 RepID=UPI0018EBA939|nr:VirK/YbjX family protein [Shimwellia pseudoproteus]MBJ3813693.1 DUF535 domain-containing protein [Shimwellia pseudoproteus]